MQCNARCAHITHGALCIKNRPTTHSSSIWINTGISYNAFAFAFACWMLLCYDGCNTHCCCAVLSLSLSTHLHLILRYRINCVLFRSFCCSFCVFFSLYFSLYSLCCCYLFSVFSVKVKLCAHQTKNSQNSLRDKIYAYIYMYKYVAHIYIFLSDKKTSVIFNLLLNCTPHLARLSCLRVFYWYTLYSVLLCITLLCIKFMLHSQYCY